MPSAPRSGDPAPRPPPNEGPRPTPMARGSSAQPDELIAQSMLRRVRAEHRAQSRNERTRPLLSPWKSPLRDENDAVVRSASIHPNPMEKGEVTGVLADHAPVLRGSRLKDLPIGHSKQLGPLDHSDNVVVLLPQELSDHWILLLIEQQPQRRAASCCRFAAAAPCSNNSSFVRIQSSISPRWSA